MKAIRHWLLALQYFTRIPVSGRLGDWIGYRQEQLPRAMGHLPSIGLLIGSLSALTLYAALAALPHVAEVPAVAWVCAILSTAVGLMLTGAFHEDGLADLADGLGGAYTPERALEIMKDSRIGAFGAITINIALLLKVALIASLIQLSGAAFSALALIGAHVCSRFGPLLITAWLPHVGDTAQSKSKPIATQVAATTMGTATVWVCLTLFMLHWLMPTMPWWLCGIGALIGCALIAWRLQRRLKGFTGDGLGAAQQFGELAFYLVALVAAPAALA